MRSAKMRNGRAVLYSSATTDKVNAMSPRVVVWYGIQSQHPGRNDIDITLG